MAVPTSGTLELEELAREAYYGQYGGNATTYPITGPIFLYDLVNGGNSAGSGMSYPAVNTSCLPNPADRGSYVEVLQVYKYTNGTVAGPFTHYLNPAQAATASAAVNTDILYSNAGLTTTVVAHGSGANSYWYQLTTGLSNDQLICGSNIGSAWDTTGTGAMSNKTCGQP
tara:strand:- start:44 stop:553 length:510 start_codon:yes stop_codon:yes gene_type:complete